MEYLSSSTRFAGDVPVACCTEDDCSVSPKAMRVKRRSPAFQTLL